MVYVSCEIHMSSVRSKRRIERVRSDVQFAHSSGVVNKILHTAEDRETLTRIIIRLRAWMTGDFATPVRGQWQISVWPRGQQVALDPATTESLDRVVPLQEIAAGPVVAAHDTAAFSYSDTVVLDTKAMRKMMEGDELVMSFSVASSNSINWMATVYQWYKE